LATLVVTPSDLSKGKSVVVTGAAWGVTAVVCSVISPNEESDFTFTMTPVANAITSVGVCTYKPGKEGLYTFSATDGTSTVKKTIRVNKGGA
jgi:hypothetical protein